MKRDVTQLTRGTFDVVVIGGGIYGACAIHEAALRGLSVALIDKGDFCGATSANSLKIIHGGLRYLQQADFVRMRESIRERRTMLRIAPHLVHPMPVAVPTYGHGMKGKALMSIALVMNDVVSFDRNRLDDPQKHIPAGRAISRAECLRLFPGVNEQGLTGAVIFCDAQVYNSERLALAFVQSAAQAGAVVANYVEATGFVQSGGRVTGVQARDILTGDSFDIRAKVVVNMAGPWASQVLAGLNGGSTHPSMQLAKAINVVTRPLFQQYAVGVSSRASYKDRDALINKGSRLFFVAPWRNYSLVGTAYLPCSDHPDSFKVTASDIQSFLDEFNQACPGAKLSADDVLFVHKGLLPMKGVHPQTGDVQLSKHYSIEDERNGGIPGLITVVGVKYTTARDVAQKTIDRVFALWGQTPPPSRSAITPIYGGDIKRFDDFMQEQLRQQPCGLQDDSIRQLVYNYGSTYRQVLEYLDMAEPRATPDARAVLKAQIQYAVHNEMALRLADVVFRRTELGTAGSPGSDLLSFSANIMGAELGWSAAQTQRELQAVIEAFSISNAAHNSSTTQSDTHPHGTELAHPAF